MDNSIFAHFLSCRVSGVCFQTLLYLFSGKQKVPVLVSVGSTSPSLLQAHSDIFDPSQDVTGELKILMEEKVKIL